MMYFFATMGLVFLIMSLGGLVRNDPNALHYVTLSGTFAILAKLFM